MCHLDHHRQFRTKIIGCVIWIPDVAESNKNTQRIQPKPKNQSSSTGRPVCGEESTKEIEKDILFGHEGTKHSTRTVRPVGGQESTQVKEIDIDFRIPGLSHAVVKEEQNFRVQEIAKKIESHPHREALQADLQQNNVLQPIQQFSERRWHLD